MRQREREREAGGKKRKYVRFQAPLHILLVPLVVGMLFVAAVLGLTALALVLVFGVGQLGDFFLGVGASLAGIAWVMGGSVERK